MKTGKLQGSILDRSVFKVLHRKNKKILCRPKVGGGFQLLHTGKNALTAVTVNVVEGTPAQVGALAVARAVNSMICSGAKPVGIMLSLSIPTGVEEPEFRQMMKDIDEACLAEDIELMGGHTQVSEHVSCVVASVTGIGLLNDDGAVEGQPYRVSVPKPGQDIVMTKWAGLSGSWLLEQEYHERFTDKYNSYIAGQIAAMKDLFSVSREAKIALSYGMQTLYDLSEGGVFGGLWEVAAAGNVGLSVDLKKIPLKQETVELCDFIDVNPYTIASMGSLLIAADHGEQLVRSLEKEGIAAAVIGCFTQGHDRIIVNDDEVRYLEPPR